MCSCSDGKGLGGELRMAVMELPESGGAPPVGATVAIALRLRRRDTIEAVGLLLGILAVLLAVAVTLGAAPPG
jgi:hypothetical protein